MHTDLLSFQSKMQRRNIFNTSVSIGPYHYFLDEIFALVEYKIPSYVCFTNVHMLVEAHRNPSFQKIVNEASIVAPDGRPLSIFLNKKYGLRQDRVCGMDIFPDLLREAERRERSIYFYGTTDELLEKIIKKAKKEYPALKIAGSLAPPFRDLTSEEHKAIINRIRSSKPDLIFVALGCPKQEKWMAEHRYQLNACLLGLGQAFKVYAGEEKRLPKWMHNLSLEWMYRLYLEPKRLWKRYAITNTYFLFLVITNLGSDFIRHFFSRSSSSRQKASRSSQLS